MKPDSSGPATAMPAPTMAAVAISSTGLSPRTRSAKAAAIKPRQLAMVPSSPKRTARRGADGASRPISSTGRAVVRLTRPRLRSSASAIRSISGAKEVIPGRKLMAASTRASMSSQRDGLFTANPESGAEKRVGHPTPASGLPASFSDFSVRFLAEHLHRHRGHLVIDHLRITLLGFPGHAPLLVGQDHEHAFGNLPID